MSFSPDSARRFGLVSAKNPSRKYLNLHTGANMEWATCPRWCLPRKTRPGPVWDRWVHPSVDPQPAAAAAVGLWGSMEAGLLAVVLVAFGPRMILGNIPNVSQRTFFSFFFCCQSNSVRAAAATPEEPDGGRSPDWTVLRKGSVCVHPL